MQFRLTDAVDVLSRTPAVLRSLIQNLPPEWVETSGERDGWPPYSVVGHLIHGEETDWIPRARIILENGESRTFEPFDREAQFEKSKGKSLAQLLDEFTALRTANLVVLAGFRLSERQLTLRGRHPALGSVTLGELLASWVVHDLSHINQVCRAMARQYDGAVGPWKAYMGILNAA